MRGPRNAETLPRRDKREHPRKTSNGRSVISQQAESVRSRQEKNSRAEIRKSIREIRLAGRQALLDLSSLHKNTNARDEVQVRWAGVPGTSRQPYLTTALLTLDRRTLRYTFSYTLCPSRRSRFSEASHAREVLRADRGGDRNIIDTTGCSLDTDQDTQRARVHDPCSLTASGPRATGIRDPGSCVLM